jgi:NAD+ kinase
MRAMILVDGSRPALRGAVDEWRPVIEQHFTVAAVSYDPYESLDGIDSELAIVLGGDGSILRAAHQMGFKQRPVLGVNLGRLGFLAALQPGQLASALPEIAAGRHQVFEHLMFECSVIRNGQTVCHALGLNEAEVLAGPPFSLVEIQLYVDGELATTYSCDGLIISTPVGSTAHALSAGGPILRNTMQAFAIVPISAHTLTHRPVVDSADRTIELVVPQPHGGTSLVDSPAPGDFPGEEATCRTYAPCSSPSPRCWRCPGPAAPPPAPCRRSGPTASPSARVRFATPT